MDAALTRPGRVDYELKFGRCTNQCLIEMYEHFFNDTDISSLWPEKFDKSQVPNERWTPAEVTQILLNNIQDPQQGLLQLVNEFPQAQEKVDIADKTLISIKNPEEQASSSKNLTRKPLLPTHIESQVPNGQWTPVEATQILHNNIQDSQQRLPQILNGFPQAKVQVNMKFIEVISQS